VRNRSTGVPPEILKKAEQVREDEKDDEIVGLIQTLTAMKSRTKELLEEASDLLEIEHNEFEQLKVSFVSEFPCHHVIRILKEMFNPSRKKLKYGQDWTQSSPKELTRPFWDQSKKINNDWERANSADVLLLSKLLAGPPIALENCFPSASLIDSPYDDQTLTKTEILVNSLNTLKGQRTQVLQELREAVFSFLNLERKKKRHFFLSFPVVK